MKESSHSGIDAKGEECTAIDKDDGSGILSQITGC